MEPPAFVPLLLLNLADAKNPSGTSGRVLCVSCECEKRLFDDQQQAHFEFALCSDAVQAVFVKTEALACGQLVVLALVADDGLALQCGQDGVAGSTVRGQAGALVKGHQHEFHVVGVGQVQVGDAALFVRDQILRNDAICPEKMRIISKFTENSYNSALQVF